MNCLPGLVLNCDPPYLTLPSRRYEPLVPGFFFFSVLGFELRALSFVSRYCLSYTFSPGEEFLKSWGNKR
jgi:hypothetical protein